MPNVSNVRVYGLDEAIRAAKYPKAVELDVLTAELTDGIKACSTCPTGEGHDNALNGIIVQFDLTFKKTDIPAHKIGRQWKFKLTEVDEWVKSGKSAIN